MAKRNKPNNIVKTINGLETSIENCRKFEQGWYLIGDSEIQNSGDCYLIDGKYYRIDTGIVVYNHTIKRYVIKDSNLMTAVIDINEYDDVEVGFVTLKVFKLFMYVGGILRPVICEEKLLSNKAFREELSTGFYWSIKEMPAAKLMALKVPKNDYKHSLPYDSKGITNIHAKIFEKEFNDPIGAYAEEFAKVLGNLTFGVEFETVKGYIPQRITDKYGIIPLRDGSISGIEYVTIPMSGSKGIQATVNFLKELDKRTTQDHSCSMHVHLGNIPRTKEFILAFMKTTMAFQDQIYRMFPLYKKYNFKIKNKNYSSPLPTYEILSCLDKVITSSNIDQNFSVFFEYLSGGEDFRAFNYDLNKVTFHPADSSSHQKWNIKSRYHIHNFIPLIFGNKETIEFRIHTATTNPSKVIAFLAINAILVNYTIKNTERILAQPRYFNGMDLRAFITDELYGILKASKARDTIVMRMSQYMNNRAKISDEFAREKGARGIDEDQIEPLFFPWDLNELKKEIKEESPFGAYDRYFEKPKSYRIKNEETVAAESLSEKIKREAAKRLWTEFSNPTNTTITYTGTSNSVNQEKLEKNG